MKRYLALMLIIILTISLTGCKSSNTKEKFNTLGDEEISTGEILTIADYFPFKENRIMDYEGIGNEYAERRTFIEFVEGNKAQIKIMNPGTVFVKVVEYKDGEMAEIFSEGEFYHIENMLNSSSNTKDILLKEPLEVGNLWSTKDGHKRSITSLNQRIETPLGIYEALEVTTEFDESKIKDYYVKDIGLVASIFSFEDGIEIKTLLKSIENKEQEMEIISFYPTAKDIGTAYVVQSIEFGTNDSIEDTIESVLKNPPTNKLLSPISSDTKINKIHLNRSSWTLEADFSKELLEEMNAGSTFETEILKSIVNTLGKFYDVDKVYLTIEGTPYESGHYGIRIGEYFKVDTGNIEEFKER